MPECKLTPKTAEKIIELIENNVPYEMAAWGAGICEKTLYVWLSKGKEDEKNKIKSAFSELLQGVKEAECKKIAQHLLAIQNQEKNWQSRAWILERRWRKQFGQDAGIIQELLEKQEKLEAMLSKCIQQGAITQQQTLIELQSESNNDSA